MSGHGTSIEKGARIAQLILNEEDGILGKKVELIVLDTQSDPSVTVDRTKELIEKHDVKLLIGTGTSASSLAAITPATEKKVPFIYSLDGECKTCSFGDASSVSTSVWGSGFTERMIVEPYLKYLEGRFRKSQDDDFKVFFVGGDYVYPRTTNAYAIEVAKKLGFTILAEEYTDMSTKDYTPVIRRILDENPDLLIVTNPGAAGVSFMRQALQLELNEKVVIGGFATFDQEAIDAMGNASEGVFVVNRYSKFLNNTQNDEFLKLYSEKYSNDNLMPGPTAAAGSFGSIMLAAKAFNQAKSDELIDFRRHMNGAEMMLPQGPVRVNPDNQIFEQHVYIMQIRDQQYNLVQDLGIQIHPNFEGCSVK
ncbi:hypothetical protein BFP97_17820 [Roseivirga sp. 4D4]|nr:hypothetical protein BFP97_17820 [Roseivirga sp. 4D4]